MNTPARKSPSLHTSAEKLEFARYSCSSSSLPKLAQSASRVAGVLLTVAIEAFTFGKLWSKEPFEKYVWERELFNPEMDPNVILMLKPFQLGNSIAAQFQVPNLQLRQAAPRLAGLRLLACASLLYLLATNPFLLTNRKYLEHKSSRITTPIWLVNAKRTGRVCTATPLCKVHWTYIYYLGSIKNLNFRSWNILVVLSGFYARVIPSRTIFECTFNHWQLYTYFLYRSNKNTRNFGWLLAKSDESELENVDSILFAL